MVNRRHLFLTGEIQVGKSTMIRRALEETGVIYDGFSTGFGENRDIKNKSLFMKRSSLPDSWKEEHVIVQFEDGIPQVRTPVIERLGIEILDSIRVDADCIVMDECGRFEGMAENFKRRILEILDMDIPVVGIVRKGFEGTWLDQVKQHKNVVLLEVTRENREEIFREVKDFLLQSRNNRL